MLIRYYYYLLDNTYLIKYRPGRILNSDILNSGRYQILKDIFRKSGKVVNKICE